MEENQEEAAEGREQAERKCEENATRGCTKKDVVAEEENFVGVVVGLSDCGLRNCVQVDTHWCDLPRFDGLTNIFQALRDWFSQGIYV